MGGLIRRTADAPLPDREVLHRKYRPQTLDDVIGQDPVVANLTRLFEAKRVPHSYLFTGPSGTGKTTLARILGTMVDAQPIDVDAARYSTVDTMRELLVGAQYVSLTKTSRKMFIVDECHRLSRQTWDTLLLAVEEPREHLYWAFCTTEPDKVPKTIVTRCHAYDLKPVRWDLLAEYLHAINIEEKLNVVNEFVDLAARAADGSVRQGLVFLSMLDGIVEKEAALRILESAEGSNEEAVSLARILCGAGGSWGPVAKCIAGLAEANVNPETIRLVVLSYANKALGGARNDSDARKFLAVMAAFSMPCNPSERMAPIWLSAGGLILGG